MRDRLIWLLWAQTEKNSCINTCTEWEVVGHFKNLTVIFLCWSSENSQELIWIRGEISCTINTCNRWQLYTSDHNSLAHIFVPTPTIQNFLISMFPQQLGQQKYTNCVFVFVWAEINHWCKVKSPSHLLFCGGGKKLSSSCHTENTVPYDLW